MIATDDFNVIFLCESILTVKYSKILKHCDLIQHKLINQISSNLTRVTSENVLPFDKISNQDAPYVINNIWKQRFESRLKYMFEKKQHQKSFKESATLREKCLNTGFFLALIFLYLY